MKNIVLLIILSLFILSCNENTNDNDIQFSRETKKDYEARVQWFRDAKIGVIFHWGPGSLSGEELSWSRIGVRREKFEDSLINEGGMIPSEIYDSLYKDFNPYNYNPEQWIEVAENLGAKYTVFVTKHHDGFCMFDTKTTDYKITSERCPANFDAVSLFAEACHKSDLHLGLYYSQVDWYDPDYMSKTHSTYIDKMYQQINDILSNYGDVSILWFDTGLSHEYWDTEKLVENIKKLQPKILINDRIKPNVSDFQTPEGFVRSFNNNFLWETVLTIGWNWSWVSDDEIRSAKEIIDIISRAVGNDGNIMIGIGPHPDGYIPQNIIDTVKIVGNYIREIENSIYATRGGPYIFNNDFAASTHKDSTIFIHVLDWRQDTFYLPALPVKIDKVTALTGGTPHYIVENNILKLTIDPKYKKKYSTIFEIKIDKNTNNIAPINGEF